MSRRQGDPAFWISSATTNCFIRGPVRPWEPAIGAIPIFKFAPRFEADHQFLGARGTGGAIPSLYMPTRVVRAMKNTCATRGLRLLPFCYPTR